jgi:hypothetical protein
MRRKEKNNRKLGATSVDKDPAAGEAALATGVRSQLATTGNNNADEGMRLHGNGTLRFTKT